MHEGVVPNCYELYENGYEFFLPSLPTIFCAQNHSEQGTVSGTVNDRGTV